MPLRLAGPAGPQISPTTSLDTAIVANQSHLAPDYDAGEEERRYWAKGQAYWDSLPPAKRREEEFLLMYGDHFADHDDSD